MNPSLQNSTLTVLHILFQDIHAGVELHSIQRVLPLPLLEVVPGGAPYLVGLMNLAGKSIPVIDLCMRLGMQRIQPYLMNTPILLCFDGSQQVGIIVDEIIGLVSLDDSDLQMKNDFAQSKSPFLAIIPMNRDLSLFLNIKQIIAISLTAKDSALNIDKELHKKVKKHE